MLLPVLLSVAMLSHVMAYSFTFTDEHRAEITACWQNIWYEELENMPGQRNSQGYMQKLLSFNEQDVIVAEKCVVRLCQGPIWNRFVLNKDMESTLGFVHFITTVLQQVIHAECTLTFPPKLSMIADEITRTGLHEDAFLARLRQAFLAFTIIVSRMDYMYREAEAAS